MNTLTMKNWFSHGHKPHEHVLMPKIEHVFRDERFWIILGAAALVAVMFWVAYAISSGKGQWFMNVPRGIMPYGL